MASRSFSLVYDGARSSVLYEMLKSNGATPLDGTHLEIKGTASEGHPFTLGRASTSSCCMYCEELATNNRAALSRLHATIKVIDGELMVEDCKTMNGTFLNGVRLHANTPAPLHDGDVLTLGGNYAIEPGVSKQEWVARGQTMLETFTFVVKVPGSTVRAASAPGTPAAAATATSHAAAMPQAGSAAAVEQQAQPAATTPAAAARAPVTPTTQGNSGAAAAPASAAAMSVSKAAAVASAAKPAAALVPPPSADRLAGHKRPAAPSRHSEGEAELSGLENNGSHAGAAATPYRPAPASVSKPVSEAEQVEPSAKRAKAAGAAPAAAPVSAAKGVASAASSQPPSAASGLSALSSPGPSFSAMQSAAADVGRGAAALAAAAPLSSPAAGMDDVLALRSPTGSPAGAASLFNTVTRHLVCAACSSTTPNQPVMLYCGHVIELSCLTTSIRVTHAASLTAAGEPAPLACGDPSCGRVMATGPTIVRAIKDMAALIEVAPTSAGTYNPAVYRAVAESFAVRSPLLEGVAGTLFGSAPLPAASQTSSALSRQAYIHASLLGTLVELQKAVAADVPTLRNN